MRTASRKTRKTRILPLLFIVTRRTVLFLFLFLCAMILFYMAGNYQNFLDSDQRLILRAGAVSAILLTGFCAAGAAECAVLLFLKKSAGMRLACAAQIVLMILAAAFAAAFMIVFRVIDILSLGIRS